MPVTYTVHRITVDEYHRMQRAGIFDPGARLELVEGELVETLVPMNPPHASTAARLTRAFYRLLADREACIRAQLPVTLGDLSEPEPDIAIVRAPESLYDHRHPEASDILALIEISDTSRPFDLNRKVPLYATFGIPETWVVDVAGGQVHVFQNPSEQRYREVDRHGMTETIALLAFPEIGISLSAILPPPRLEGDPKG